MCDGDRHAHVPGNVDFPGNLSYHVSHGKVAAEHGYVLESKSVNQAHNWRLWTDKAENAV